MEKMNLSTNFLSFLTNGSLRIECNNEPAVNFISKENLKIINIIDIPIKISKKKGIIKQLSEAKEFSKKLKQKNMTLEVQLKGETVLKIGKDANPRLAKIVTLSNNIEIRDLKKLKILSDIF